MPRRRFAFTLIELLVVVGIMGILMSLLLPAVQKVREAASNMRCRNNLSQLSLAVHLYENFTGAYPPSMLHKPGTVFASNNGSWSIHGRILPFVEQGNAYVKVNLEVAWDAQGNTGVPTTRVPVFLCPSEVNDRVRTNASGPFVYPQNYGFNFGTWFVYDPATGMGGDGVFFPNGHVTPAAVRDGASNTLCAAEVKAFTPYVRNTKDPGPNPPASSSAIAGMAAGGQLKLGPGANDSTGHTEWPDGRVHHSGFTTVFTPNTVVPFVYQGIPYDIDYNSRQEGSSATQKTYAAITSRSYHPGGVNVVFMDRSARFLSERIDLTLWRALGTRAGFEVISDF